MRCCAAALRSAPTTRHFSHWTVPPTRTRNLPEAEYNDLESIEIPGDTTLWKTQNIPPKKIHLPIEAYGNFRWYFPVFGVVAALALYYSAGFYRIAAQNWAVGSLIEKMTWSTEVLGCLIICVFSTGILTRDIFDSVTSRPLLIITKEALWDRRQLHAPVPWCDIESIRFQSFRDTLLVHLKLAQTCACQKRSVSAWRCVERRAEIKDSSVDFSPRPERRNDCQGAGRPCAKKWRKNRMILRVCFVPALNGLKSV